MVAEYASYPLPHRGDRGGGFGSRGVVPDGFHVVPGRAAVFGVGDTVVGEAVALVPRDEVRLAGEDDAAFAACAHGGEVVLQQFAGDALTTVCGQDNEAEYGGISAIGLVQGGVVVVGVGQVGDVGDAAVDEAHRLAARFGDEELFGEDSRRSRMLSGLAASAGGNPAASMAARVAASSARAGRMVMSVMGVPCWCLSAGSV